MSEEEKKKLIWKGKHLKTFDLVKEALQEITTKEEAQEFLKVNREVNPEHADDNLGYLFGYFSRERWKELSELFGILHPIFKDNYNLTDDEILQAGIARGRKASEQGG